MDPTVVAAVGRIAAAAIQRSQNRNSEQAPEVWSEESDERGALILQDANGNEIAILTQDQTAQVSDFLEYPECTALCQFMLIALLGCKDNATLEMLTEDYKTTFELLTEEYCENRGYNWGSLAGDLWDTLVAHMLSLYPRNEVATLVDPQDAAKIQSYIGSSSILTAADKPPNVAFRQIADILGDRGRFSAARNSLHDIRSASERHYSELNLAHTLSHSVDNFRFDHEVLYVGRALRVQNTQETRDDGFLTSPTMRPRCVVIGNPGVGKSTMTHHLAHTLSSQEDATAAFAALVVPCKEVANADGSGFILSSISRSLRDNLQLDVNEQVLNDIATMGRAFVIFDGVDEIIDITRRTSFVRIIEAFAARYPLIPILVTARRVGYNKAPLAAREFDVYELGDFSDEQVEEYTRKWFDATGRNEAERAAFLRETENVPDVRTNPLMLSLLCALYRARGYIPRNRRDVYKSCADLLFQRWDAMRQIEQPVDHRHYGTRLMQELALFFYNSQAAQAGVQEKQLRKIIAQFFTSNASVDSTDAETRAQDFLNFCADRAWLLSYRGMDERDQRLFGFTHRTFMEYFAAEAVVRRSRTIEDIVSEVVRAYERDASSVLADVIVQCADDKYDGGAREVVAGLMDRGRGIGKSQATKYISLCLRIMNAAPLPPHSTDAIFDALFTHWSRHDPEESSLTAIALFDLYRDPRSRFVASLKGDRERAEAALKRWGRFYFRGETSMFEPAWSQSMYEVAQLVGIPTSPDPALNAYLLDQGLATLDSLPDYKPEWLVAFTAFGRATPGPVLVDLQRSLADLDTQNRDSNAGRLVSDFINRGMAEIIRFSPYLFADAFAQLGQTTREISAVELLGVNEYQQTTHFLLWASCALYEYYAPSYPELYDLVDGIHGKEWFDRVAATRTNGVGRRLIEDPQPFTANEVRSMIAGGKVPHWFDQWCRGILSFSPERPYER